MSNLRKLWVVLLVGLVYSSALIVKAQDDFDDDEMINEEDFDIVDKEAEIDLKVPSSEKPVYSTPRASGNTFLVEPFDDEGLGVWVKSQATKDDTDEDIAKYDGKWSIEEPSENPIKNDLGLVLKTRAKHHAISAKLTKPFTFADKPLIVQYEVKFQTGQECGGAYIKLLSATPNLDLKTFGDKTAYTIMFGPDKCGNDNKLHFIFRHKNPVTGELEEKHAKKPTSTVDNVFTDKNTHLFTLVVNPDNSFEVLVDQDIVNSGSLLDDFEPPVNPAKEIVDPNDKKPKDWDEREKVPNPDAVKPDDWDESQPELIEDEDAVMPSDWLEDESELISDPTAKMPEDWDDEIDGEWEAPMINNPACEGKAGCGPWSAPKIKNPKYKGKWKPDRIDNPEYKGKWKAQMIPNPDYFEDKLPYKMTPISAIGLELWSMSNDIYFDNFIVTDDRAVAEQWAADTWEVKRTQEKTSISGKSVVQAVVDATNERPWLWAVFILVVVLPIVLVIAYCCMPASKPSKAATVASRKKTDAPTPDDVKPKDSLTEAAGMTEEVGEVNDDDGDEEEDDEEEEEEVEKKSSKKAGKSALDADEDDAVPEVSPETARQSPRKRRGKPPKE